MTYAQARLGLGISAVGSLVVIATIAITTGLPAGFLSEKSAVGLEEVTQIIGVVGFFMLWLMPLDFLGGFLLPKRFDKSTQSFREWLGGYLVAILSQGTLFVFFGVMILFCSQSLGTAGVVAAISLVIAVCFILRNRILLGRECKSEQSSQKVLDAIALIQSWQLFVPRTIFVDHNDVGFTGGIVGVGKGTQIVMPKSWLEFSREQLATAIARRAMAIENGSYSRGLIIAVAWNVCGFALCSISPGAGLGSVAGLVTTLCGFTLWSFLGLLILPTVSRNASLIIDQSLVEQGMQPELISRTAFSIDQMQDGEPERSTLIETIFHPVPNVSSRNRTQPVRGLAAWNVARTTLFFSWPCLGFLSRAVHCNIGRPELWTMLPTD